ncbi:heme/hemin ABC transporter substrate-binding protein [Sphingobacterium psychroaquaticum]|uniref:Iron complex transport system substrate-binding protein n=1 Tax=Sphingobacterium psychroaquaticum TaxID=561061 RepID=A0A1X7JL71_9SPHI|nr:ABC transporter substrate-binding protein [Sphingobacterium psychroaquaticum]QBQ40771.1 hemin ABC transporter substrate-binding protein [Sphingobacterium psychroaquaticum]SMG28554.1 iron complex transport system substrate-binding protein [Sphingobacterium psychroaquaticum]
MLRRVIFVFFLCIGQFVFGKEQRIVTLNTAITETVFGLGLGEFVVATDVTSISPKAAAALPKVSRNRSLSAEGIMAFKPTIVLVATGDMSKTVVQQLRKAGINVVQIQQEFTAKGAFRFMQEIADALSAPAVGKSVVERTKLAYDRVIENIAKENQGKKSPKVLFIYARGTGTMSVAGKGSSLDAMIELAGAKNAIQEFADFKPYTTEALVQANPDVILMFDFGASSLGGKDEILKMPGVRLTEAGKQKRILVMNASLLVNFSTRLPEAITELHKGLTISMAH